MEKDRRVIFKIFIVGLLILVGAIFINIVSNYVGIDTWYDFIYTISSEGLISAVSGLNIFEFLFLFLIYPVLLGLIGYYASMKAQFCLRKK